ncbi:MAG: hypothetical protein II073_05620 [Lachnospiraceae bacterium]|nr:hypothetical protein [Lachnospiraceae bacterium]
MNIADARYQNKIIIGFAKGLEKYFKKQREKSGKFLFVERKAKGLLYEEGKTQNIVCDSFLRTTALCLLILD